MDVEGQCWTVVVRVSGVQVLPAGRADVPQFAGAVVLQFEHRLANGLCTAVAAAYILVFVMKIVRAAVRTRNWIRHCSPSLPLPPQPRADFVPIET